MNNDTIYALSSGHGKSGVAVIRVSGNQLHDIFAQMVGKDEFTPRTAYFTNLRDTSNDLIDQVILIYFASPASFTGEDIIEIHSHGAPAVIRKIFEYLNTLGGRMAEPGEFSRRAFYNNKMDLADVDGLAALLDATTEQQRRYALHSLTGGDSQIYNTWRKQMIEISGYAAAILDYDADDLPKNIGDVVKNRTQILYNEISKSLSHNSAVRAIRGGFNIVLAGEPNVGKSSLFNYLAGANRAIVSDIPGTTRDVVSINLDIDGYLVNLSDTAGLRNGGDIIEQIGIEKTYQEIENANLIIRVFCSDTDIQPNENEIIVINKSDLLNKKTNQNAIYVSAKTGDGTINFMNAIRNKIHTLMDNTENALILNARTYTLLTDAATELQNALKLSGDNYDIFSEHVHRASDCIGKILGQITAADVMDATFGQLCLGK